MSDQIASALTAAIRDELIFLWSDLTQAISSAVNGRWSIQCDCLVDRIVELSRLVGPTPWREIDVGLLRAGIYARIYRDAGIEIPAVDHAEVERLWRYINAPTQ